jgi:threonine synthase
MLINNFCPDCIQPLLAKYNLHKGVSKSMIKEQRYNMWRYQHLLPVESENHFVNLGEGWTPMLTLSKTSGAFGIKNVLLKEEGLNPTGSFIQSKGTGYSIILYTDSRKCGKRSCSICSRNGWRSTYLYAGSYTKSFSTGL